MTNITHDPVVKRPRALKGRDLVNMGELNVGEDLLLNNVGTNLARAVPVLEPHPVQGDREIAILGGGPSLQRFLPQIKEMRNGQKMSLVTTNGTYGWALENGMRPSAQVLVDARAFNKRFVTPHVLDCRYFLSSQCHPEVFDELEGKDHVYMWHARATQKIGEFIEGWYACQNKTPYFVPGGSTVMLRTIPLLASLGFVKMHIFGFDSCLVEDNHHSYSQPENENDTVIKVTVPGSERSFHCHPWMVWQAQEFIDMTGMYPEFVELNVYGDGLISDIVRVGAKSLEEG